MYEIEFGEKTRAWRVVLYAGFLRVCPIQPHFLRRICLATGSCPARSHSSSFRIFSGHRVLKMRLRQARFFENTQPNGFKFGMQVDASTI
nr:hypothetical protein BaRGS_028366 [Batillaria attramentaria]